MALTKKQLATALTRDFETTLGSYASGDARNLKKQCDRLANFAYIAMKHLTKDGKSKIVERCSLPVTAHKVVKRIYTDLCTLEYTQDGLKVLDIVADMSHEELENITGVKLLPK